LDPIEQAMPLTGVPALVIRADQDHLSSLDWAGHLAGLAPDGRLARLPGLGHDAFYQAAETVAAVAAPFLAAGGDGRLAGPGARSPGVGPW
jgi:pimeloyl-ACP methyl ester carboxylesterase